MNKMLVIFLLLISASPIYTTETYENSTELCKRCSCQFISNNQTLKLNCANKGFQNMISNWPTETVETLIATFSHNNMTTLETLPGSGAEFKVVFDHCGIKYLNSGLFESCTNVTYVDLSYNLITSDQLSPDVFKGPYNDTVYRPISLKHLNLAYNQLHSLNKNLFEHLPNLEVLNLEGNDLRVLDFVTQKALASAQGLQILNLAKNELTEIPKNAIFQHPKLKILNLSGNDLDFVPYSISYIAQSLEKLIIDDNPIFELVDTTFVGLNSLLELSANNLTKLKIIRTGTFIPTKNLKVLRLNNNNLLNYIDKEAFGNKSSLQELYLNNNGLVSLDKNLLSWSQLQVLEMEGGNLYCTCDLYNISTAISEDIKKNKNGPFCMHPTKLSSIQIYELTKDICLVTPVKYGLSGRPQQLYGNVNIQRMAYATMSVIVIIAAAITALLVYSRWKSYKRSQTYPYPSQVTYTPLAT